MRNMKKWIAAVLTITMAVSDCGVIPAFAAEDALAVEKTVSGNNAVSGEMSADGEPFSESEIKEGEKEDGLSEKSDEDQDKEAPHSIQDEVTDFETDTETKLPALHIGQIKKGEKLPDPSDSEFVYDLPISLDVADCLVLFANYDINMIPEQEENGTLLWSILRGEKGTAAGSANLMNEEDDWTNFEVVSDSPYFIMTENEDEESDYYKMIELAPEEADGQDVYDYYIRAAYYLGTGEDKDEAFYAAATVPFVLQNVDMDEAQDDAIDEGESPDEVLAEGESDIDKVSETVDLEKPEEDETSEAVDLEKPEEDETSETVDSENAEADQAEEMISTISGNDIQPGSGEEEIRLILSETDIKMIPGDAPKQVTATIVPGDILVQASWSSSDKTVAAVDQDGVISARAEGKAQITAEYGDITAVVKVEVVRPDTDQVIDLSGDIWVAGFEKESDDFVYTGQKITQDIRIYYKDIPLQEKTDYTLTYKNNVNAAAWNSLKAPSVTVTLKGQYSGSVTLYYTIKPANIKDTDIYNTNKDSADEGQSSGYVQAVNYSTTLKIPNPELTFGKAKLKANKDFVCDYVSAPEGDEDFVPMPKDYTKGASYELGKIYNYIVKGIGNYTGFFKMQLVVVEDKNFNFSTATVTLDKKQYEYHGTPLPKSDVTISSLKVSKAALEAGLYDYEVYAEDITGAYVMVYPSKAGRDAGYYGYKKVNLKLIGDRNIKDAALGEKWKGNITFSQKTINEEGGIFQEKDGLLTFGTGKEALREGQDYTIKYSNAKKAGKVTVTFTGKGRYKGSLKKQYEITPNGDQQNFKLIWKNVKDENGKLSVAYQKGGAVPEFILKDQDNNILKNKTDYTVKLKNNTAPGNNMSCEISGKGNYKGYSHSVELEVTPGDISKATISVADKPYSEKPNAWKSKVTVKDVNGKTLAAGKDYEREVTYSYTGTENEQPPAGTIVTVTVKGMGFYADPDSDSSLIGRYRIFQNNISRLQIVIDNQEYTGKEIALPSSAIHVYASVADKKNKIELPNAESCYKITEYKNNIKVGTAKVTLQGIGDYGGTKTYSFKILKKAYLTNRVKSIKLDKTSLNISLAEKGKRTLTATITPNDASQEITNPTVIWTTSNSTIATVKAVETVADETGTETDTNNVLTVKADITVIKTGTVTITAIAQDGNKKATCTVKISVPTLKEKDQIIQTKTGDTYQLTFIQSGDSEVDYDGFTFESTNESVASVDGKGLVTMKRFGMVTIKVYVNSQSVQQCHFIVKRASDDELNNSNVLTYEQEPGCKDDTAAINDLLRKAEHSGGAYDTVYIPDGTYHINTVKDGMGGIILTDNQNLIMSPNAKLVAIKNSSANYQVIWAFGRQNVTISGGQIIGDRDTHSGGGEWGQGIKISGCTNVYISDVEVSKCWGDGIYIGFYDGPNKSSNGVIIENCNLHHNRRNNLSITDASNVTVRNSQFNYANGTDPQYGIDIEPNNGRTCSNVTISGCTFQKNAKGTIQILGQLNAHVKDVKIENCTGDKKPVEWSGFGGSVSGVTYKNNKWN
ncbi:MAG: hypothetical protein HDR04_15300 [Lachnospiraceae bacterium]|nr:hypothetical protein [Lachnospiraceae bacterium]